MNKETEHCKYSDSCFTCPKPDCVASAQNVCRVNKIDYDLKYNSTRKECKDGQNKY